MLERLTSSGRRRTNLALLWLVPITVLTGLFANTIGTDWPLDPALIHAVAAVSVAILAPWKSTVVRSGLRRRRPSRFGSLALLALVLAAMVSGAAHATDVVERLGPVTVMQIHVGSGLLAIVLLVSHFRSHPVRARPVDFDRRSLVRSALLGAAAASIVGLWEWSLDRVGGSGAVRRFTGSHERSSFAPAGMPETIWFDDRVPLFDDEPWMVDIAGALMDVTTLADLATDEVTAILDCTSGWYSEQTWTCVRLDRLIPVAGHRSIEVRSATGYARRFPARDAANLWLATELGRERLSPGHGYPLRLVAPGRRGFWWVKWVDRVVLSDVPWWVQAPFPLT